MSAPQISYTSSEIMKVTASFKFDRYIAGRTTSLSIYQNINNNLIPASATIDNSVLPNKLATGKQEMLWRNLNQGTGRLDDPRPRGVGGPYNPIQTI
jgi:hypothetical protein